MDGHPVSQCEHKGHIWLEANGQPFQRYKDRPAGMVAVACRNCPATTELEGRGTHSGRIAPTSFPKPIVAPPTQAETMNE